MQTKKYPSKDLLESFLEYDAETGIFVLKPRSRQYFKTERAWKIFMSRDAGRKAGGLASNGYRYIALLGTKYLAHRLAMIISGTDPYGKHVDHINGDRDDNRLSNLRLVDNSQNHRNGKLHSSNTSGVSGVCWDKSVKKWIARVFVEPNVSKTIGVFQDIEDAKKAVIRIRESSGYTDRHGKA
ncbi:HNH endonuclease [Marinobacter sp. OP 3.4]|uniref:HNH endonuclease n=1 Tax=Marinobacter sp. OP 3.4 TaxID=3076501 RepID=UPI002E22D600